MALTACNNDTTSQAPVSAETKKMEKVAETAQVKVMPEALKSRMASYEALFAAGNIGASFDYVPPKLRYAMMQATGENEASMRDFVEQDWKRALETVSLQSFDFDLDVAKFETSQSDRPYVLIPSTMIVGVNDEPGKVVKTHSTTVAIMDGSEWYVARLDDEIMLKMFQSAYPDLAMIELPESTMKKMDASEVENMK